MIWVIYGYSLAFTAAASNDYVGGFSKVFLMGVTPESMAATFSNGVVHPEYVYICFQMTFACITPALIVGGFAERMKFSALDAVRGAVGHIRLFPDRAHGLVLGRPRRHRPTPPRLAAEAAGPAKAEAEKGTGCGQGRRRSHLPVGRDRLRRRHGRAHQLGYRGARRRADARQAYRLPARSRWPRTA